MNTFSTYSAQLFSSSSKYIWLEVSVKVEPDTVDAVAETLGRCSYGGVSIQPSETYNDECDDINDKVMAQILPCKKFDISRNLTITLFSRIIFLSMVSSVINEWQLRSVYF